VNTSVCGILRQNGLVLIAKRAAKGALGGKWEFPGGKVEPFESPQEALRREFAEELAIRVEVHKLVSETTFSHQGRIFKLLAFEVSTQEEPTLCGEHTELRWVSLEQLQEFDFAESDKGLLPLRLT
jgi:mutator protein MutT